MAEAKKQRLNPKQKEKLLPSLKEFNNIGKALVNLLNMQVEKKERRISLLVSRVKKPKDQDKSIDVTTTDISPEFLAQQRKKNRGETSEWDDYFTKKKGWVI